MPLSDESASQVSVVQPLMSGGLAILAVFSHFYLDERLHAREWVSIGVTGLGIVGLGMSTEEEPETPHIVPFRIAVRPRLGRTACHMRALDVQRRACVPTRLQTEERNTPQTSRVAVLTRNLTMWAAYRRRA